MLNHGLIHGFFLSPFKLISCLIHRIVCVVSLFQLDIWILEQFYCCPKWPALPRHIEVWASFELFGALYMYISDLEAENPFGRVSVQLTLTLPFGLVFSSLCLCPKSIFCLDWKKFKFWQNKKGQLFVWAAPKIVSATCKKTPFLVQLKQMLQLSVTMMSLVQVWLG